MTLTANREVDHYIDQELRSFQMAGNRHIYKGALVGLTKTGYAQQLAKGDKFAGVAYEEMNNTATPGGAGGLDGDHCIRVYTLGDFGLTLVGATIADIGRPVFASADDTLTFERGGHPYVGMMQDYAQKDEIILRLVTLSSPPE